MSIVSLLPSTTEILFAVGAGDDVVGVTFECDFPAEARERTIVSTWTLGTRPATNAARGRPLRLRPRRGHGAGRGPAADDGRPRSRRCPGARRGRERLLARPGTRLVDGVEELARILHP